ncbi:MAG: MBL fold metallo-hydrolase [Alphaproteobacteria bacterium BRH_c36]|nr:MAG: MBL fold metallo-hydrolase [Alphaproteobacteria bacterium BRH_c36]
MAQSPNDKSDELVFLALGGLGEIGMNVYLYGIGPAHSRQWLMVDLGITFPGPTEPGVDVVLPDLRFIAADKGALAGLIVTHAHEDHIGAIIELWPQLQVPVYATPFTMGMLKAKLSEFGGRLRPELHEIPLGGRFNAGPFDVEFISMTHSIPETSGLAIRTPNGNIFHSSDWKLDPEPMIGKPIDQEKLKALGREGIDVIVCDSTNILRDGVSPSETDVANSLTEIIKKAPHRVAVTTFASNLGRVLAVAKAAHAAGRHLVVAGRSLHRVIDVGIDTGYLPPDFKYLDQEEYGYLERSEIVVLLTGSQGEPRAALSRAADGEHPDIKFSKGDLVIYSSRNIPGNEKAIGRVQNALARLGCEILTDSEDLVHVTGHPRRGELRQMYDWIQPKALIPMHGEARHLRAHAKFANECGIKNVLVPEDGAIVRLAPGKPTIVDDAPVGRIYRDGRLIVPGDEGPVRERRKLSAVGIAVASFTMTPRGELISDVLAILDGIPAKTADGDSMEDVVLDAVESTIESIPKARRKNLDLVRDAVYRAVRAAINEEWGKKPIVKILLHVVE